MSQPQATQPNSPQYPLTALALFPLYVSQSDYKRKTGQDAPTFDPTQPVKNWADSGTASTPYSGPGQIIADYIMYPANTAQSAPIIVPLATAGTVNMVPDGWTGGANVKGTALPLRPLLPNEKLVNTLFGGWMVQRTDLQQPSSETTDQQFADIKATLAAIQVTLATIQTKLGA
jgi:hypothetical protein